MPVDGQILAFGEFEVDEALFELRRDGKPLDLQPTPFRLLAYLLHAHDRVVPKRELLDAVWPGVVVSDAAFSSALKEVRRALGDDGWHPRWIVTRRRVGLRFIGHVSELARTTPFPGCADERRSQPWARGDSRR